MGEGVLRGRGAGGGSSTLGTKERNEMKTITGILAVLGLGLGAAACSSEGYVFSLEVGMCFDD